MKKIIVFIVLLSAGKLFAQTPVIECYQCKERVVNFTIPDTVCVGSTFNVLFDSAQCPNISVSWLYLPGEPLTNNLYYAYSSPGNYTVSLVIPQTQPCDSIIISKPIVVVSCQEDLPCENCIGSFAPEQDKPYLLSAWVKDGDAPPSLISYVDPVIEVNFVGASASTGPLVASGLIIDGWQRIEKEFTIPVGTTDIEIKLNCLSGDCYFDDIRILPFDGSMKSYVYDPVTLRLSAELDERNYATFYEYDEEGKLVRIKKETERGVMTIQESKTSIPKSK